MYYYDIIVMTNHFHLFYYKHIYICIDAYILIEVRLLTHCNVLVCTRASWLATSHDVMALALKNHRLSCPFAAQIKEVRSGAKRRPGALGHPKGGNGETKTSVDSHNFSQEKH